MNKIFLFISFLVFSFYSFSQTDINLLNVYTYLSRGDTSKAIEILSNIISKETDNIKYTQLLANIYIANNNYEKALPLLLKSYKENPELAFYISLCYAFNKNTDSTIYWLEKYLKYDNKIAEFKIKSHHLYQYLKNNKKWEDLWKHNWYSELESQFGEIELLYNNKQIDELIEIIENLKTLYPNNEKILLWRAKAYLLGQNKNEAIKSLDKILKINPLNTEAILLKIKLYEADMKYNKAANLYLKLYNIEPYKIYWLYLATINFNNAYKFNQALEAIQQYLKYDSLFDKAFYQAGIAANNLKKYNLSIKYLTKAIELSNGFSEPYYERSCAYYELGQYENAFADICMAMDLKPMQGKYFYQRGLINYAMNKNISACSDFEKAKKYGYLKAEDYIVRFCSRIK